MKRSNTLTASLSNSYFSVPASPCPIGGRSYVGIILGTIGDQAGSNPGGTPCASAVAPVRLSPIVTGSECVGGPRSAPPGGGPAATRTPAQRQRGTGDSFLDSVTTHLITAGGKRLRPLLALAAATGGEREASHDELMGAVAVELVHLASLYHDDVIDEATIRRNVESVNSRFGNLVAIVAGDYLLARSAAIAASLGTEIAALLADTLGQLCQGQVSEVRSAFRSPAPARTTQGHHRQDGRAHVHVVPHRRAHRGPSTSEVDALTEYGHCFGMVFQIRDDILDITATAGELAQTGRAGPRRGHLQPADAGGPGRSRFGPRPACAPRATARPARAREGVRHRGRVVGHRLSRSTLPAPMSNGPGMPPRVSPTTRSKRA